MPGQRVKKANFALIFVRELFSQKAQMNMPDLLRKIFAPKKRGGETLRKRGGISCFSSFFLFEQWNCGVIKSALRVRPRAYAREIFPTERRITMRKASWRQMIFDPMPLGWGEGKDPE